ncbi:MAG: hypothetical protein IT340_19905 [Chloroflexi bacterium]|nr:hypothetical protein [Chloroflexota bacterium]
MPDPVTDPAADLLANATIRERILASRLRSADLRIDALQRAIAHLFDALRLTRLTAIDSEAHLPAITPAVLDAVVAAIRAGSIAHAAWLVRAATRLPPGHSSLAWGTLESQEFVERLRHHLLPPPEAAHADLP